VLQEWLWVSSALDHSLKIPKSDPIRSAYSGRYYNCNSAWYRWGRWVLAGILIFIGIVFLLGIAYVAPKPQSRGFSNAHFTASVLVVADVVIGTRPPRP